MLYRRHEVGTVEYCKISWTEQLSNATLGTAALTTEIQHSTARRIVRKVDTPTASGVKERVNTACRNFECSGGNSNMSGISEGFPARARPEWEQNQSVTKATERKKST